MFLRPIHYSTELTLKAGTDIHQAVELSDSNVSPMRDFDISVDVSEINLRIIIDSMNNVIFDCERLCILFFVNNCVNALDFSSFVVIAKDKKQFT